jgi:hypothetical protein
MEPAELLIICKELNIKIQQLRSSARTCSLGNAKRLKIDWQIANCFRDLVFSQGELNELNDSVFRP